MPGALYVGYKIREPVTFQGLIQGRDENGAPLELWACEHSHSDTAEADRCANEQLRHALAITTPQEAPK